MPHLWSSSRHLARAVAALVAMAKPSDFRRYGSSFSEFITTNDDSFNSILRKINDLALSLKLSSDDRLGGIRVFLGLDLGFNVAKRNNF